MVFVVRVRNIQNCQIEWIKVMGGFAWYFVNFGDLALTQPTYTQCEFPIISTLPNYAITMLVVMRGLTHASNYGDRRYLTYKGRKKEKAIELGFQLKNIIYPYFYYIVTVYENNIAFYQRFSYFDLLRQSWSPAAPMASLL